MAILKKRQNNLNFLFCFLGAPILFSVTVCVHYDMPIFENEMLQLRKCEEIFFLNRKVSKLSFGNIKFVWKCLGHPCKSQNFKFKIQQETFNKKDVEIRIIVSKILLFIKDHLWCVKNGEKHAISCNINKSLIIWVFLHFFLSKCDFW